MAVEAQERFQVSSAAVAWLQRHPRQIGELSAYLDAARQLEAIPLRLLEADIRSVIEAADLSARHGLLTNDALILALMRRYGLRHLVTNDDDFDGLPELTVWKPR